VRRRSLNDALEATDDQRPTTNDRAMKIALSLALVLLAACSDATRPIQSTRIVELTDPVGDTLPGGGRSPALDVSALDVEMTTDSITLTLRFTSPVLPDSIAGILEIDADANASTGFAPFTAGYRSDTGVGVEYSILVPGTTSDVVDVYDIATKSTTSVPASYAGNALTMRIPRAALGSPRGRVRLVGVIGTVERPTDLLPNTGNWTLDLPTGP
jgi:hypothetical protein